MIAGYYGFKIFVDTDKQALLIGEASYGHYQIELTCTACHSEAFGGPELIQDACLSCHENELDAAHDSHPKKKFNDPRNADLLEIIDARYCVSCHTEHQKEQTLAMGLTIPEDYCFHCHEDIGKDRPSHQDLAFDSCASAGCHNYHDNRALYENFLVENSSGPWLNAIAKIGSANDINRSAIAAAKKSNPTDSVKFERKIQEYPQIHSQWLNSAHAGIMSINTPDEKDLLSSQVDAKPAETTALSSQSNTDTSKANVNCGGCHTDDTGQWLVHPGVEQCQTCHSGETKGFLQGKHGLRLAHGLSSITPGESYLPMKGETLDTGHSCVACHGAHDFNTRRAAQDSCLDCHNDQHSLAFKQSPHGQLFDKANKGEIPLEQSVSCATCHMPRLPVSTGSGGNTYIVEHNQNLNLRPNEKMIRPVCMQCHSLGFAIDALADDALIKNNFTGQPSVHIPSIDWVLKREKKEELQQIPSNDTD